jgi:hypothetical protein
LNRTDRFRQSNEWRQFTLAEQGDQIGRIFAHWVIVYLGNFFLTFRSCPHVWGSFLPLLRFALFRQKIGLGHILGDFFKNSFGHPVSQLDLAETLSPVLKTKLHSGTFKARPKLACLRQI